MLEDRRGAEVEIRPVRGRAVDAGTLRRTAHEEAVQRRHLVSPFDLAGLEIPCRDGTPENRPPRRRCSCRQWRHRARRVWDRSSAMAFKWLPARSVHLGARGILLEGRRGGRDRIGLPLDLAGRRVDRRDRAALLATLVGRQARHSLFERGKRHIEGVAPQRRRAGQDAARAGVAFDVPELLAGIGVDGHLVAAHVAEIGRPAEAALGFLPTETVTRTGPRAL